MTIYPAHSLFIIGIKIYLTFLPISRLGAGNKLDSSLNCFFKYVPLNIAPPSHGINSVTSSVYVPLLSPLFSRQCPCVWQLCICWGKRNVAVRLRSVHLFCTTAHVEIAPWVSPILSQSSRGRTAMCQCRWELTGRQKFYRQCVPDIL